MGDHDAALADSKRELRTRMRRLRRDLTDRPIRSKRIVAHLVTIDAVRRAGKLMVYDAVPGEVDLAELASWAVSRRVEVAVPEDEISAAWPDVIVVPGTAFTVRGERVGQGGGWYDRYLPGRRADAITIGVGFEPQIVDAVPVDSHDVVLDCIVTENGPIWPGRSAGDAHR